MGLLHKPWPANEGNRVSSDREKTANEIDTGRCGDTDVASKEEVLYICSNCSLPSDKSSVGQASSDMPLCDGPLRSGGPSLPAHGHPLLGPFQRFPGTQFWKVYWLRKEIIKRHHLQFLTESFSVIGDIHRDFEDRTGNMIYHHEKLQHSFENQMRDGIAEGPLLSWLIEDHLQLLKMSKFVLRYFQTVRMPFILATDQEQDRPRQL